MDRQSQDSIEVLEKILGSLRITKDYILDRNRTIEIALEDILIIPAPVVYNETAQVVILKSMVISPGWFYSDQMKFKKY